jgi:hypothetical protein
MRNVTESEEREKATLSTVIDRYLKEEFSDLAHRTQQTNRSLI